MKRWVKVLLIAISLIVFIIFGIGLYFYWPYLQSEPNAVLRVETGRVEIDSGKGFFEVKNIIKLTGGETIRTWKESEAEIIFASNSQVRLDENTEILIKELYGNKGNLTIRIKVIEGDVWNDISPVSGIGSYVLETPDGNITDLGTSFGTSVRLATPIRPINSNIERPVGTTIAVVKGYVKQTMSTGYTTILAPTTQATCNGDRETVTVEPIKEDQYITKNIVKGDNWIIQRREEIKKKYRNTINTIKSFVRRTDYKLDDNTLDRTIDSYLKGEINVNSYVASGAIPRQYIVFIPKEFFVKPNNPEEVIYTKDITKKDIFVPIPKDVVVDKKECSFGQLREEIVPIGRKTATLRGVDSIGIKDWKGYRGIAASEQKNVVDDVETGLKVLDYIDKAANLFDIATTTEEIANFIASKVPDALYGAGSGAASGAMIDKLKEWQNKGALGGLPEWIEIQLGPIWEKHITKITNEKRVYVCENGAWKYRNKEKAPNTYEKGKCFYLTSSPIVYRYQTNIENINLEGCTAGSCPKAWAPEFPKAVSAAMSKYHVGEIGKCPTD